ncbi:MAG: phosphoenolpyruvate--protein phosphotransferase [Chromatiales bacterium 21-64-14]|nr:MAG: phosphoenolpyruvate--protein phosphotransferase [Chromatiales bacterium 21-64-14]HQU16228.1 phosphoenolpyruvate--protein phosphotransferase [Gammaproteobacteria bacterium]
MLDILSRIVQEVSAAQNLGQALSITVAQVRASMSTDACSVYLTDHASSENVLMATEGLNPDMVGKVRLKLTEGLIGVVHGRAEPMNLEDAPAHPNYRFVAETGEGLYHGFLGVPIIHYRKVLGVLVVRNRERRKYAEEEVSFLVTLAAQLAGAIAHAEASGGIEDLAVPRESERRFLTGLPGSPGVGIGTAAAVYPPAELHVVPDRPTEDVAGEEAALRDAFAAVRQEIGALSERMRDLLPPEEHALFDAYALMLDSDSLLGAALQRIHDGNWAQGALRATIEQHVHRFDEMHDTYLRERGEDIRDLGRRILIHLQTRSVEARQYPERAILIGTEISATQLAEVPSGQLAGVVCMRGSSTSHVSILARAMGVPAVMGVEDLRIGRLDGQELIVDGYQGRVHVRPNARVREEFQRLAEEEARLVSGLEALRDLPAETPDGVRIPLYVNTGLLADITPSLRSGAEGVGLYRTELPFMMRDRFPGEEEQRGIYLQVLQAFAPRPVTLRTLDIGGDKALPYFPVREENPFLGWRGIRISLDHPEIFITQLRAMLRADAETGNLQVLLPMVSGVAELDEALCLIRRAYHELIAEGEAVHMPLVGAMIEVPSAVYQAAAFARRADFLSVGTNDLTQYLLAVDRNNGRVAALYDALHPAVLQALVQVVEGAHRHGKPVSVCGEMAGDPAAAVLLLGMGIDSLSTSAANLPRVKWVIRSYPRERAQALVQEVLKLEDPVAIRKRIHESLDQAGLGGLIHAGQ